MGNDIGLGELSISVCFDLFSSYIVGSSVLGNRTSKGFDEITQWWPLLPAIQAIGKLISKYALRSECLSILYFTTQWTSVGTKLANSMVPLVEGNSEVTKGGSDLVWYSIDRDIFKTESIFCRKNGINPVRSHIGLPRSLYSLLTADIKSDFLYIKWSIFILINVWF